MLASAHGLDKWRIVRTATGGKAVGNATGGETVGKEQPSSLAHSNLTV